MDRVYLRLRCLRSYTLSVSASEKPDAFIVVPVSCISFVSWILEMNGQTDEGRKRTKQKALQWPPSSS